MADLIYRGRVISGSCHAFGLVVSRRKWATRKPHQCWQAVWLQWFRKGSDVGLCSAGSGPEADVCTSLFAGKERNQVSRIKKLKRRISASFGRLCEYFISLVCLSVSVSVSRCPYVSCCLSLSLSLSQNGGESKDVLQRLDLYIYIK